MSFFIFYGAIILIVSAATGLLQLLIWLVAMAVQLLIWAFWAVAGGLGLLWLAITDRKELARIWRESDTKRHGAPFGRLASQHAVPHRLNWNL